MYENEKEAKVDKDKINILEMVSIGLLVYLVFFQAKTLVKTKFSFVISTKYEMKISFVDKKGQAVMVQVKQLLP